MDFAKNTLFADKFDVDEREPQLFFTVPNVGTFGLTSFDPNFYTLSFALLMLQSVINILAAIVIYTFIVKQSGSTSSYLIGYGIVCPLLVYLPFRIIEALDLRNIAFMTRTSLAIPSLLFSDVWKLCIERFRRLPNRVWEDSFSTTLLPCSLTLIPRRECLFP
jgi:hypothetical protein